MVAERKKRDMPARNRVPLLTVLTLIVVGLGGTMLVAHMKFAKSTPAAESTISAPPAAIQVWLTQRPDVTVSKLALAGPSGTVNLDGFHVVDDKSIIATVAGKMSDGVYTVNWQAAGEDGHIQKSQFRFTLKRAAQ
jgi:methionine-rich copper-binding protein CopC